MRHMLQVILALTALMYLGSCAKDVDFEDSTGSASSQLLNRSIQTQEQQIGDLAVVHGDIRTEATAIQTEADVIKASEDPIAIDGSAEVVKQRAGSIIRDVDVANQHITVLNRENANLKNSMKNVTGLERSLVKLAQERDAAKQESVKTMYRTMAFFFGIGFLVVVGGLLMTFFVTPKKWGLTIAGIGLMGMALAAGSIYYLKTIAVIAIISIVASLVLVAGIIVWFIVKEFNEKETFKEATVENVTLIEDIKNRFLDKEQKKAIFNDTDGIAMEHQSDKTIELVKQIRSDLTAGLTG